jgi:4-amino-4-deoxy-L-arabinose transferase-like glycosyltransferase
MKENVLRFVSSNAGGAGHEHPFYYFIPNLFLGMAPWSFFLPPLAVFLYQRRSVWREQGLTYLIVWIATVFLFYSTASGKRAVYILPLYPALALLLGYWWQELRCGTVHLPGALIWLYEGEDILVSVPSCSHWLSFWGNCLAMTPWGSSDRCSIRRTKVICRFSQT